MARKVRQRPRRGCVGHGDRFGEVDERHVVEFGAADPLGLQNPEQAGRMKILLGLRWQPPQLFRPCGPLAQLRHERPCPRHHGGIVITVIRF